jgi:nitrile hydratase subunit beta
MNGGQDLGGMMGFNPVTPRPDDPVFHQEWERKAFALTLAVGALGEWNIDAARHAREAVPPSQYLSSTYFELWLNGLTKLIVSHGLAGADEIKAGQMLRPAKPTKRPPLPAEAVAAALAKGGPSQRPAVRPAQFKVGDRVRTRTSHPAGHTRLPRYARGKSGVIELVHGVFVFPDSNAHFKEEAPDWCYSVAFTASELWGEDADPALTINVDCWEPYLARP